MATLKKGSRSRPKLGEFGSLSPDELAEVKATVRSARKTMQQVVAPRNMMSVQPATIYKPVEED